MALSIARNSSGIRCWAESFGGCAGRQSAEHVVSAAIFKQTSRDLKGFAWCRDASRKVGLNAFTANILCEKHNSMISPLDAEAARLFQNLENVPSDAVREDKPPGAWITHRYEGMLLERWFTKTAINFMYVQEERYRWPDSGDRLPSWLVKSVFGAGALKSPMGLYFPGAPDREVRVDDATVEFCPLFNNGMVAGAAFDLHGMKSVLWLSDQAVPEVLPALDNLSVKWDAMKLTYRPRGLQFLWKGDAAQMIFFRWS